MCNPKKRALPMKSAAGPSRKNFTWFAVFFPHFVASFLAPHPNVQVSKSRLGDDPACACYDIIVQVNEAAFSV
eukprot:g52696.t1